MEWVETTGRTVDEAKERALEQLGVEEIDAEIAIVEEPRPGLFGRLRGEARVRARVRPTRPRPKAERRDRRRRKETSDVSSSAPESMVATAAVMASTAAPAEAGAATAEAANDAAATAGTGSSPAAAPVNGERPATSDDGVEAAAEFLRGLLACFRARGQVELGGSHDEVELRVTGDDLGLLIGPRGQTLLAIQDLARLVATQGGLDRSRRLHVDVAGYREKRREALARFATQVASQVASSGIARSLEPMSAADRKVVHDTVNAMDGVSSRSEGEDPYRRVVIVPEGDG